jgi:phage terminase large subunit
MELRLRWIAFRLFERVQDSRTPNIREWPIKADSARPETIDHLNSKFGFRITKARKGADSVKEGIEFLKTYDIVVDPACRNTIDELTLYSHKTHKLTGEI